MNKKIKFTTKTRAEKITTKIVWLWFVVNMVIILSVLYCLEDGVLGHETKWIPEPIGWVVSLTYHKWFRNSIYVLMPLFIILSIISRIKQRLNIRTRYLIELFLMSFMTFLIIFLIDYFTCA